MATIKYKDENGQWQEIAVGGGESVEVVDNLESDSTTAALSANQGRVLKEMMVELRELLQGDSEEIKAYNLETLRLVKEGKAIVGSGGQVFDTYREREFRGVADLGNGSLITVVFKVSEDGLLSTEMQYAAMPIVLDPDRPESFMDFKSVVGSYSVTQVYIYGPPHSPVVNIVSTGNEWWFFYFIEGAYVKDIWTDDGEFVDTVTVMNIP